MLLILFTQEKGGLQFSNQKNVIPIFLPNIHYFKPIFYFSRDTVDNKNFMNKNTTHLLSLANDLLNGCLS